MTKQEAIETIRANWPPENYTMLREALTIAIDALDSDDRRCRYCEENGEAPCCTHSCNGCTWYW